MYDFKIIFIINFSDKIDDGKRLWWLNCLIARLERNNVCSLFIIKIAISFTIKCFKV